MNYIALFAEAARRYADLPALTDRDGGRTLTYAQLDTLSGRVAGKLRASGLCAGDFVAIRTGRCAEYIAAYLGVLKAGCVAVPLVPEIPAARADYIRENCGASLTVTEEYFSDVENYAPICENADGKAPGLLIYTSGSTGAPKGILHSVGDLGRAADRQTRFFKDLSPLRYAACGSFGFICHVTEYLSVFLTGGEVFIVSDECRRSAVAMADFITAHGITATLLSPQILRDFHNPAKSPLRRVITGSERVSGIFLENVTVFNVYGMSEVFLSTDFVIDRAYENTPVGKPIPPVEIAVCDASGNELPDGQEGEIRFIGEFDTCYFKDPVRTCQTMIPLPDGRVAVKSGDVGYKNENGDLIYVNRRDNMVKIRGQRVETQEIEFLLLGADGIRNAAVKAFPADDGQTVLAAFYEADAPLREETLRDLLRSRLPEYMIPSFFVPMQRLPKNINGKIDRAALAAPDTAKYKAAYAAPKNGTERVLCRAFEEVLHCGEVGADDDFFLLGGDSVRVLRLVAHASLPGVTPDTVTAGKTPRAIAALAAKNEAARYTHEDEIPEVCPLTESQRGVYLECVEEPERVMYNISLLCGLPAGTDPDRFAEAVKTVAAMHPALFVTVSAPGGVPSMIYRKNTPIEIPRRRVGSIRKEYQSFVRPFDLENGPLFRFAIWEDDTGAAFLCDVHHIVFDGTSVTSFLRQIAECYDGKSPEKEDLTVFDISRAEVTLRESEAYRGAREFFREQLEGVDCDSRPFPDRTDTEAPPTHTARLTVNARDTFDPAAVRRFVRDGNVTENALFAGAFSLALSRFNGTPDVCFCTACHGRHDARLASAVGMFVKTVPLHFIPDDGKKVADFLPEVRDVMFRTFRNDCISFGDLAADHGVNSDTVFIYQGEMFADVPMGGGSLSPFLIENTDTNYAMDFMVLKNADGYELCVQYDASLYTEGLMRALSRMFCAAVRGLLREETLGAVVLTDDEARRELDRINRTEADYPCEKTVVDLFRAKAKETPDAICTVYGDRRYTYREVDEMTDRLAGYLVRAGIGKEKVVGVLIPRCEYIAIASLGVLKAGGAYMPLDPSYPPERLNLMMRDADASLLICDRALSAIITDDFTGERLYTDLIPGLPALSAALPTPAPEDLFVMLYTSGSTGTPKGVMFTHANALVTAAWVVKYFGMDGSSRVALYASYGFDAHVFDLYSTLIGGGQIHIIAEDIRLDFPALRDYFNENGLTHAVMTMQVGRQFALMGGLSTLRHLSVAGEKLTPLDPPAGIAFYNLYGPTEGSVITSAYRMEKHLKDVPIGKPVDNLKIFVVDKAGKLLPPGAIGELWIAGPHVTRGYRNRPEKTAEAYGDNPFCDAPGYGRVYRTGDIVRLMPDGNLQFVGRRDAQVKVRGFRVELTEVEEVIRRYPGVKDATVAAFDDPAGGKFIAAYIVSDEPIGKDALADFIRAEKPPYMMPAVVMAIDRIPLTQNHKVNKRALPAPKRDLGEIAPPENAVQTKIFDIISEVVGHREFGIRTDLYEAGLNSIGSVKLNVALADAFGVTVRTADIRANATVEKLEAFLFHAEKAAEYETRADYPITETQSGLFTECMASPASTVYNIPLLIKLGAGVDPERLADAVRKAIDAHPYVKTRLFADATGAMRAKRCDGEAALVKVERCAALPESSVLLRPFDLVGGSLYRAAVYITPDANYLFTDFHHIVFDGTSEAILLADVDRAYAGQTPVKETFTGFDAALAEEEARQGDRYPEALSYWKELLTGKETACLPKKEPEDAAGGAGTVRLSGANRSSGILDFCQKHDVTPGAFFNAVFGFVGAVFAGKEEFTYATVYNGRNDSRLSRAAMLAVKTLPATLTPAPDKEIAAYLREAQTELLGNMANDLCSFASLAADYGVTSDVIFAYQGEDFTFDRLCGEEAEATALASDTAKAPLSVNVFRNGDGFDYTVEYRKDTFNAGFARALADSLAAAADEFCRKKTLGEVSLLTEAAKKIYGRLNDSALPVSPLSVPEILEGYALTKADATAVSDKDAALTFAQMNRAANRIANALLSRGVGRENIIGMLLPRDRYLPVTELAINKAGCAFLPMIPGYPDERIEYCLTNAESPFVITTEAIVKERAPLFGEDKPYRALTLEELLACPEEENPGVKIPPESLAYCIYTSGSTGTPKGVMIEHRNYSNMVQSDVARLQYYRSDTYTGAALSLSSIAFDMSLYEISMTLCAGKAVYITTEDDFHNPPALLSVMRKNEIQMMTCTPSFMNNIAGMPEFHPYLARLVTLVLGAEAFPASLYDTLRRVAPGLQIVNGYGPTEASVCCSDKELHSGTGITIGRPTGNVKMFVLDKKGNILPPYGIGELIICGAGVGRGYVKLPEKTAASFFRLEGLPAYHSGDLVRLTAAGEIDFGGRIDNQVKLRGFRVELDEIEKVMGGFDGIRQTKVLVRNNGTEDYLVGFFTAGEQVDIAALSAYMKSRLTYYMVPAVLMQLDAMPLTPNGKIDKKGFPDVKQSPVVKEGKRRAPKKSLEMRLCEIFASVLGAEEVYADDDFFALGGTSLSASKVTMVLMSEGTEVKYGDIFDNPTPESLAAFIEKRNAAAPVSAPNAETAVAHGGREALKYNTVRYAAEVTRRPLGDVLLTGAVGFLGIHVLRELLASEEGHITCLVRRGEHETPEIRLKTMLIYYFSEGFAEELRDRITVVEADITDEGLDEALAGCRFDTVINCAACVKHFAGDDILERINVHGVENLIALCEKRNAKLVQISTVSVPGIHTEESYEKQIRMHENELFMIESMDNKYILSKYAAETRIFDAIEKRGFRGKVVRVGNLMGRQSDGEFQANMETNMFLSGIRGFAIMGKYPISHMTDPMSFSPVDCTARAVVLLAGTDDKFTAFHADNRYGFDEMKIIDACNRNGITILPTADDAYYAEFRQKLGDENTNRALNGLAAYDIKDAHAVETDNRFTTNILYRIGFSWPLVDQDYLDRAIRSIMTLDYFHMAEEDENE